MNKLIQLVAEAGLSNTVYNLFHIVNFTVLFFFFRWYRKNYSLSMKKTFLLLGIGYPLAMLWILIFTWIENGFQAFGANNIVRGFVYFPLLCLIPCKLLKIKKEVAWDFIAPGFALLQGVAHIACMFGGCCHGYPSSWGLWNPVHKEILFPNQPIESIFSLLICLICVRYAKKDHYSGSGKVYPLFLILFGFTRFFLEFLRDNKKIIGDVSLLAFHAGFMVVVGAAWFVILYLKRKKSHS